MEKQKVDYSIKYIIIGDTGVGKTNIIYRYKTGEFGDKLEATIGAEHTVKYYKINNTNFKLEIWDTTGMTDFESIRAGYYKNAACAIIVYDITRKESLESVDNWIEECRKYSSNDNIITILVGNKCDKKEEREITEEEGENFKKNFSLDFFHETSALEGINIDNIFEESCKAIYELLQKEANKEYAGITRIETTKTAETIITLSGITDVIVDKRNYNKNCWSCWSSWFSWCCCCC